MKKNILFCSVGRRAKFLQNAKSVLPSDMKIIATDSSNTAPAIYFADRYYIVPKITDEAYLDVILNICRKENIGAITTFIDPEIELLAKNKDVFEELGILVLAPDLTTAQLCFDKYKMYSYLVENNIDTVQTFESISTFKEKLDTNEINFPVFVKPRNGSGSVGAQKVNNYEELELLYLKNSDLIIQELMTGVDLDVDVYIDTLSGEIVSMFSKKKIETKIGGASKTVSFVDQRLFEIIEKVNELFKFNGPIDIDFFEVNGKYYLSEINPRFGGANLHAFGCGVDFISLVLNNMNGIRNIPNINKYEENIAMLMFDDVVITKLNDIHD